MAMRENGNQRELEKKEKGRKETKSQSKALLCMMNECFGVDGTKFWRNYFCCATYRINLLIIISMIQTKAQT